MWPKIQPVLKEVSRVAEKNAFSTAVGEIFFRAMLNLFDLWSRIGQLEFDFSLI